MSSWLKIPRAMGTSVVHSTTNRGKRFSSPWTEGAILGKEGRMADHPWVKEFPGAMTVCDREGIIIKM